MKFAASVIARPVSMLLLALLCVVAASNLASLESGPLRRLVHLPLYASVLAVALAWVFWRSSNRWLAGTAACLALGFAAPVALLWKTPSVDHLSATDLAPLSLMSFNVLRDNDRYADVLAALQKARPDVLFLTEMTPAWHRALAPLQDEYPHQLVSGSNLLLSRMNLEGAKRVPVTFDAAQAADLAAGGRVLSLHEEFRSKWRPTEILTATVLAKGSRCRIACIHSATPGSDLGIANQRACGLVCAQELLADSKASARVLLGDLNTTCFSPTFRFISQHTGLRDSARGFGYSPTWGPLLPRESVLPWIGIPIDHILVSENVCVLAREIGPAIGSDHRWVLARLAWKAR